MKVCGKQKLMDNMWSLENSCGSLQDRSQTLEAQGHSAMPITELRRGPAWAKSKEEFGYHRDGACL